MELVFDIKSIMQSLPHRYPFLLVDRVVEFVKGKRIVALKNVTINEPFFQGHFPAEPIMPGVMQLEAMAQVAAALAKAAESLDQPEKTVGPLSALLALDPGHYWAPSNAFERGKSFCNPLFAKADTVENRDNGKGIQAVMTAGHWAFAPAVMGAFM